MPGSLVQDHVVNPQRVQLAGLLLEIGHPVVNSPLDDRVFIRLVRNRFVADLEQELIDTELRSQEPESRFQALRQTIRLLVIQALVIDSLDFQHHANVTALGQKDMIVKKAIDADVLIESARFSVALDDL